MLRTRVVTALLLLTGFLAMLFLLPFSGWLLFACAVTALGAWEWGGLVKLHPPGRSAYALSAAVLCGGLGWYVFDLSNGDLRRSDLLFAVYLLTTVFWLLAVPLWLTARWQTRTALPCLLAGGIVLVPACLAMVQLRAFDPVLLLAVMAAVWVADIAAYGCGRVWGRHRLAPAISPGKTWEGAVAAVAAVLVYGPIVAWMAGRMPTSAVDWAWFSLTLATLTIVGILGDLFESLAKRQAGVKDSGAILPGHGGALDRIDSLTSTLPLVGLSVLVLEGRLA
jgi:phosphatidate cytidylyltransferase